MAIRKIKAALVNTRDAPDYNTEIGYLFYDANPNGDLTLRISDGVTPGGIPITGGGGGGLTYARLNVVGDDSTGAVLNLGNATPDLQFAGTQNVSTSVDNATGKVTITGPDLTAYLQSGDEAFKIAGDDSTLRSVSIGESITIKGTGGITTTTDSEGNVTIDGSGVSGSGSGTLTISDDASTTVDITTGEDTLKFAGGQNISTSISGDTLTITGPDLTSYIQSGDNISSLTNDAGYITSADVFELTVSDDSSTTQTFTKTDTLSIRGAQNISTSISGDTLTITGPDLTAYLQSGDNISSLTNDAGYITSADVFELTVSDDSSTTSTLTKTDTLSIKGAQNITTSLSGDTLTITGPDLTSYIQSGDNISSLTNDAGYITSADVFELTISDDSSTTQTFTKTDTLNIRGAQNISTSISGDTLTITGPDLSSYLTDASFNVVADDSQTVGINNGGTLQFSGSTNITTSTSSEGVVTITGPSSVSQLSNDAGYITGATLKVVGDDSTGTVFDAAKGDDIRFLGAGGTTVTVSGSTVIITSSGGGGGGTTYTQDTAPVSPVDGDTWLDTDSGALYVFVVESGVGQWIETGSAGASFDVDGIDSIRFAADDSNSTPVKTSETLSILGGEGITTSVTGQGEIRISSTGSTVTTDDAPPSSPNDGDLWFETDTGSLYVYVVEGVSGNWIETGSAGGGGPQVYLQDDTPSSPSNGDFWWDTDAGSLYIYVVESGVGNWVETAGSGLTGGGGIPSVAADSSPELGGNLDANNYNITNIGTISVATNGNPGTDPATDSGVGYIYAKGATAELFVKDGAGNITQISPHSEEGDWVYYSENVKTGKRVKVNMEKMIRRLEEITGETFFEIDEPHKINY